jgi:MFS family permease
MSLTIKERTERSAPATGARGLFVLLLVVATAQLMLVLDDSIANIALPTLLNELRISAANLPWVINASILAFGGLLLLGGRMGDLFGRRLLLRIGMAVFTIASLIAGLAQDGLSLIGFRALGGGTSMSSILRTLASP